MLRLGRQTIFPDSPESLESNSITCHPLDQSLFVYYLTFGPTVQVLSTPWADSTMVLSAKVNCPPWMTVHFALGTTVLRNRISLGIHVHSPDRHSILKLYFKKIIIFSNQYRNTYNQYY